MSARKALVPFDGSDVSHKAVKLAADFAAKYGWEILLLHVLERPPMPSFAFPGSVKDETMRDLEAESRRILTDGEELLRRAGIQFTSRLLEGSAAEMIVAEVDAEVCDIVIIGSTGLGRGRVGSLLLGSVAEHVIRHAKVPVLIVKEDTILDDCGELP